MWPEPTESACGQQAVDESVDDVLDGHTPRLPAPNAVVQVAQTVGEEGGSAGDAKDGEIGCAWGYGASGEIGDEKADDQAIDKPHAQELRHGRRAAGKDSHHPDRPLIVFFDHGG